MSDRPTSTHAKNAAVKPEQLWTAEQAAEFLSVPTTEIERYMLESGLQSHPAYPEGRVFSKDELINYLGCKSQDYDGLVSDLMETDVELIEGHKNPFDEPPTLKVITRKS